MIVSEGNFIEVKKSFRNRCVSHYPLKGESHRTGRALVIKIGRELLDFGNEHDRCEHQWVKLLWEDSSDITMTYYPVQRLKIIL
jgi:hypothetical protein|tara:strand:+ start:895 stop:1146 length:252 start_codon:yes stop_codon:yes gene_type:complete